MTSDSNGGVSLMRVSCSQTCSVLVIVRAVTGHDPARGSDQEAVENSRVESDTGRGV